MDRKSKFKVYRSPVYTMGRILIFILIFLPLYASTHCP